VQFLNKGLTMPVNRKHRQTMAEVTQARQSQWEIFAAKLAGVKTLAEAKSLALDSPPEPDSPARSFYSNLRFFLQEFIVPSRAGREERAGYVLFIKRLDAAGELKPGWGDAIIARLTMSLDSD
jgi:hypothetical protein